MFQRGQMSPYYYPRSNFEKEKYSLPLSLGIYPHGSKMHLHPPKKVPLGPCG
jgi:hypothetical protein